MNLFLFCKMKYSKLKVNSICLIKYLKNKYCLLVNKDCLQIEREKKIRHSLFCQIKMYI